MVERLSFQLVLVTVVTFAIHILPNMVCNQFFYLTDYKVVLVDMLICGTKPRYFHR